jgi:hypothetical protein
LVSALSIKQDVVVKVLRGVLEHLPPIQVPDVHVTGIGGFYADASNISLSHMDLTNVTLSLPDSTHMFFGLKGITGKLFLVLKAGLPALHTNDRVDGTLKNTAISLKFLVNGDAKISAVTVNIGSIDLKLPDNILLQPLLQIFMPVFKTAIEAAVPPVILAHADDLDFFHLMAQILAMIPEVPMPSMSIKEGNYTVTISDVKMNEVIVGAESITIAHTNHLFATLAGIQAKGSLAFRVEKNGVVQEHGVGSVLLTNTLSKIEASVIGSGQGFEVHYVNASLAIGNLAMTANTPDVFIKWLVESMAPFLKAFLQEAFPAVVKVILG